MRKITCILLAFLMSLTVFAAIAESVPSKTVDDLVAVEVTAENLPEGETFILDIIQVEEAETVIESPYRQKRIDICKEQIEKLSGSESVEAYFDGDFEFKEMLETEELHVYEFDVIYALNYVEAYGKVIARMLFATPYEEDEKVVVMIGLVTEKSDGTRLVSWSAFDGIGVASEQIEDVGAIQVEFDPETVTAIQEGIALIAIVSD